MLKIQQWLAAHMPQAQPTTIVHGDYKLDNIMWDPNGGEPRPIALFDWEMSTLGDPLADLGWMVTYWSDPSDDERRRTVVSSMEPGGGYYNREEMIEKPDSASSAAEARSRLLELAGAAGSGSRPA